MLVFYHVVLTVTLTLTLTLILNLYLTLTATLTQNPPWQEIMTLSKQTESVTHLHYCIFTIDN